MGPRTQQTALTPKRSKERVGRAFPGFQGYGSLEDADMLSAGTAASICWSGGRRL